MIPGFATVLAASANDRRDLFIGAGNRLGTVQQNIEKDFWVCWTLDALFNGLAAGGPRLLFKGGTSLSKGYGLISRFSEDIDITVFRDDIGQAATVEELEGLAARNAAQRLDAIREACQNYINGPLLEQLSRLLRGLLETAKQAPELGRVEADPDDPDHQSLLLWYPTVTADGANYVRRAVKIEAGAKSALDPNVSANRNSLRSPRSRRHRSGGAEYYYRRSRPNFLGQSRDSPRLAAMVGSTRRIARRRPAGFTPLLRCPLRCSSADNGERYITDCGHGRRLRSTRAACSSIQSPRFRPGHGRSGKLCPGTSRRHARRPRDRTTTRCPR